MVRWEDYNNTFSGYWNSRVLNALSYSHSFFLDFHDGDALNSREGDTGGKVDGSRRRVSHGGNGVRAGRGAGNRDVGPDDDEPAR